jgi:hypothetical protein
MISAEFQATKSLRQAEMQAQPRQVSKEAIPSVIALKAKIVGNTYPRK